MAKIAIEVERALARRAAHGGPGQTTSRLLAQGDGWTVADVICTSGPRDRPYEERHPHVNIAIVAAGSFQYRASLHRSAHHALLMPGALLLGNSGQAFECAHEHGVGDRCVAFGYAPEYFEQLAADAGLRGARPVFGMLRLPPLRALSPLVARACAGLTGSAHIAWEELSIQVAARTVQLVSGRTPDSTAAPPGAMARVTRAVRMIEREPEAALTVGSLAREAGLSPYHFLRTFERLTGVTPHQYVLRTRLRMAALRLVKERAKVLDVALDCGFGDVSNFNHAFRAEFGVSPRAYRRQSRRD